MRAGGTRAEPETVKDAATPRVWRAPHESTHPVAKGPRPPGAGTLTAAQAATGAAHAAHTSSAEVQHWPAVCCTIYDCRIIALRPRLL